MLAAAAMVEHVSMVPTVTVVHLLVIQRVPEVGKLAQYAWRLLSARSQAVPTPWDLEMVLQLSEDCMA